MGKAIFPNQRIVTIHRCQMTKEEQYCSSGDITVINAIRRMNGYKAGGFLLWSVLRMNKDGFVLGMSDERLKTEYGISEKVYRKGWSVLQQEGFLVQINGREFAFYEYPISHNEEVDKTAQSEVLKLPDEQFQNCPKGSFKTTQKGGETDDNNSQTEDILIPPTPQRGKRGKNQNHYFQEQMEEAIKAGKPEQEIAILKLLHEIQKAYPYFTKQRGDPALIVEQWSEIFANESITRETVIDALKEHMRGDGSRYPPQPGEIIKYFRRAPFDFTCWFDDDTNDDAKAIPERDNDDDWECVEIDGKMVLRRKREDSGNAK